jgi:hypothetical protein
MKNKHAVLALVGATALIGLTDSAMASSLNLTSTVTNTGTLPTENYVVTVDNPTPTGPISPPISFTIGDTFNQAGSVSTASNFGASATGTGSPWNFEDSYSFSTTGATIQSTVISFNQSDVSDLQARIISATDPSSNPVPVTTNTNAAGQELVGGPTVVTIVNGWTTVNNGPIDFAVTLPTAFTAGNYILQVRGEAASSSGYGGTVQFTPVPVPAGLPLLFGGIGLLSVAARKRRQA